MGADPEPGRRLPVAAEGRRRGGYRPRRPRPRQAPRPDDADDRPLAPVRPDLRADLAAFHGGPGGVRGRLRPRVVQADPPRHGPGRALPRPRGPVRDADLAGPRPGGDARAHRRGGHRHPQGPGPRLGPVGVRARVRRVGGGLVLPRQRQARRRQRRAHPPRAAERVGGQPPRPAGHGAPHPGRDPAGLQRRPDRRQAGLAGRPDRPGRRCGRRAGRPGRGFRRRGPLLPGPDRRVAGADRRGVVRRARAEGGRVPQLRREGQPAAGRVPAARQGEPAHPERPPDDGPGRRPPRPGRELRRVEARRVHQHPRVADQRLLRQPARHGHGRGGRRRRTRPRSRGATPSRARTSGRAAASTSSSGRTPSCARSPRSTRATTRRRSS